METLSSKYINVNGSLLDLSGPCVMGILNITPDSFYAGSRMQTEAEIAARAQQILDEGARIIDIGAYSSRPNAENVSPREEMERLRMGLEILHKTQPGAVISVDTFRADVARMCVDYEIIGNKSFFLVVAVESVIGSYPEPFFVIFQYKHTIFSFQLCIRLQPSETAHGEIGYTHTAFVRQEIKIMVGVFIYNSDLFFMNKVFREDVGF